MDWALSSRLFLPLLAIIALAGCSTPIPQALSPDMVPTRFSGPVAPASQAWPETTWWQNFGDSELAQMVTEAQAGNRDLAAAAARVMGAEAQSTIQRSQLFPQISAQGNHLNSGCSGSSCGTYSNGKSNALSFNASYGLDFWGVARDNVRAADEQLKSARFAQQSLALTVTANVANQYLTVLAIRGRIAIAKNDIAAISNILDVIKLRVKAGTYSHLDLAREQAQLEGAEAQLPGLESTEKQALFTLAVLLGRPPEGFDIKSVHLDAIQVPLIGSGLPSDLLFRRPDIAQAEANLAAAHANVDAARAAFLPQISLTGSGGFVSTALGSLLKGFNFGYNYGANMLQTIFDGGRLAGEEDLAKATERELIANYQGAALQAYADVENALIQVANTQKAQAHLQGEIQAAAEAFESTQLQYRQGVTDLLSVLQAQQTLFTAEDQLVQTTLSNRQAIVSLYQALGGGWQEEEEDRTQLAKK